MSLKVYTAYRLRKSSDLWEICTDIKTQGRKSIKGILRKVYLDFCEGVNTDSEEYKNYLKTYKSDIRARLSVVDTFLNKAYRTQAAKSQRNYFDFNVSVTFREHKGRIYLIPYADMLMRNALSFLKNDPRLEEYGYWNNTDPPKGMDLKEWDRRGKIWNEICDGNWGRYLALEICTPDSYWELSPRLDLSKEFKTKHWTPKGSTPEEVKSAIILHSGGEGETFDLKKRVPESESPYIPEPVKGKDNE